MLSLDRILPALEHSDKTFKITLSKECKFKWKKWQHREKQKDEKICDKNSQTSDKK